MQFQYDLKIYETNKDARELYNQNSYIYLLPNGEYLEVEWKESIPPQIVSLSEVPEESVDAMASVVVARFVRAV